MSQAERADQPDARIQRLEQEIVHLKRELQASQASEARFRQLMDSNMMGVLFWRSNGDISAANDAALRIVGYTREDLQAGRVNWQAMTPPEYHERERQALAEIAQRGVCTPFEKEYIRKDGARVPVFLGGARAPYDHEEGVCFVLDATAQKDMERRLAETQRFFETFMENLPAVAFVKTLQGERLYLNRRYRELFTDGQELLGRTDLELFGPERAERLRREDAAILAEGKPKKFTLELPTADNVLRTWLTYKFPIALQGKEDLVGGVGVDITELVQARQQLEQANRELEDRVRLRTAALESLNQSLRDEISAKEQAQADVRTSETRLRKWLEQSVVPTQVVGPDGLTRQVNQAWEKLWGATFAEIAEVNLLTDPQTVALGISAYLARALAGEAVFVPECPFVPDRGAFKGQARWCSGVVYPIKNDVTGDVEEIVILHQDVTDRVAAEAKLRAEERTLRKLIDLQDQERKLIAYDIHDGLVQHMIGAKMLVETFDHDASPQDLEHATALLRDSIDEARRLINDLRPLVIDERGVVNAIEFLAAEEERRGGPAVQFFHHVSFDRLPPLLEGTIYRIVQECLNNARRHSGTKVVEVWLRENAGKLRILVRDYGRGFDVAAIPEDRFGLEGIARRAQIFDGQSQIESILGEGTSVHVELPLPEARPPS